jgi:3-hydroxyacyl-[acyl-carrier-protein] dehydratase
MSSAAFVQAFTFTIPPDHPSLPGHFPGRPLVPGVVVLQSVVSGAEHALGQTLRIRGVPQVKFAASLVPDELADVQVELAAQKLRFAVRHADTLIAQGAFTLAMTDDVTT